MGLILIGLNLVTKWAQIRDIIFSGAKTVTTPAQGPTQSPSGGNSVQVPIDPFLPTGPKITIPLPKL